MVGVYWCAEKSRDRTLNFCFCKKCKRWLDKGVAHLASKHVISNRRILAVVFAATIGYCWSYDDQAPSNNRRW